MNYIVLDLEWNQSYVATKSIENLNFEIIEIGAIKLNEKLKRIDIFHKVIKPHFYKKLNHHVKKVISLSRNDLKMGEKFEKVASDFLKWCGKDFVFCTWGNNDIYTLRSNLNFYKIAYDFGKPVFYLDIQKLYSFDSFNKMQRLPLKKAVMMKGLPTLIDFHTALGDAFYTMKIMQNIHFDNLKCYITYDTYTIPLKKKEEIHIKYKGYYKYISRGFCDADIAMKNREVRSRICPYCEQKLTRKLNWFRDNSHNYSSIGICEQHGAFIGKIKLKNRGDTIFAIKTLKKATNEDIDRIIKRKELLKLKKRQKKQKIN